jgi:hypothetical protein
MPKVKNIFMVEISIDRNILKELGRAARLLTISDDPVKNLDFKYYQSHSIGVLGAVSQNLEYIRKLELNVHTSNTKFERYHDIELEDIFESLKEAIKYIRDIRIEQPYKNMNSYIVNKKDLKKALKEIGLAIKLTKKLMKLDLRQIP